MKTKLLVMIFNPSKRSFFLCGMITLLVLCYSCSNDDFMETDSGIPINSEQSAIENEILALVNSHRQDIGKSSLTYNNLASELAEEHNHYMVNQGNISHDNFNQRADILSQQEDAKRIGENVASGYTTAQTVMTAWLNSTGHRDNIEGDYTHIGISAIKNASGSYYYTQLFLKK